MRAVVVLLLALALAACAHRAPAPSAAGRGTVAMGGEQVRLAALRPAEVAERVQVSDRGQEVIVRAFTLIDLPDAVLRHVGDDGLKLVVTLDNGVDIPVQAPAAYVRGYLQALDAAK